MIKSISEYIKYYSYLVEYSWEDEAYIGKCLELGIMAHGETQEKALMEIKEATRVYLLMLEEDGEEIPKPFNLKNLVENIN